jgi:ribonuclease P protein component
LIGRVRDRQLFDRLRTSGRRIRRGSLTVTYVTLDGEVDSPLVAFAIGRRFGPAVARNRARRRLREAFRQARASVGAPIPAALLVQARPSVLDEPFTDLVRRSTEILLAVTSADPPVARR